jgi:hypothetical protein
MSSNIDDDPCCTVIDKFCAHPDTLPGIELASQKISRNWQLDISSGVKSPDVTAIAGKSMHPDSPHHRHKQSIMLIP